MEISPSSSDSFSHLHLKRDAALAGLSYSRLVQGTSLVPIEVGKFSIQVDEYICNSSLESIDAHLSKFKSFPSEWKDLQTFLEKHSLDRPRHFFGNSDKSAGVDFMVVDLLENLLVPTVSIAVPSWNSMNDGFIDLLFDFASSLIHDDGALLIIHTDDPSISSKLKNFIKAYQFRVFNDWMGINRLQLTNARD